MRLTWYGTAALLLKTGDTVLAFDPFEGIPSSAKHPERGPFPHKEVFARADHVFVTHGHFDHILMIPGLYRGTESLIHATGTPLRTLKKHGVPGKNLALVRPGDEITLGETKVRVFSGRHCRFDAALLMRTLFGKRARENPGQLARLLCWNFRYAEKGEILVYEVSHGGKRVMILGSLGLDPETVYPVGADILILPFQGKSDLEDAAIPLVKRLRPKKVLLDHYDDSFPPMTSEINTERFIRLVEHRCGIPCRALQKGRTCLIG